MNLSEEINRIFNKKGVKKIDFLKKIQLSEEEFLKKISSNQIDIELYEKIKIHLQISTEELKGIFIDIGIPTYVNKFIDEQIQETIRWKIEAYRFLEQLQKYEPNADFMFKEK